MQPLPNLHRSNKRLKTAGSHYINKVTGTILNHSYRRQQKQVIDRLNII